MNETNCHSTSSPSSLSSQSSFATVNLFGIPVAKVTEEEAVARIIAFAKARNSQLTTHNSQLLTYNSQLTTPNSQLQLFFNHVEHVEQVEGMMKGRKVCGCLLRGGMLAI